MTGTPGAPTYSADLGQHRTHHRARVAQRRQDRPGQAEPLGQLECPVPRAHVVQPGRRGVGALGTDLAGQPVGQQVGQQQQPLGRLERRRADSARQLVDRVERQLLQPGDVVQLRVGDGTAHPRRALRRCASPGGCAGCRAAARRGRAGRSRSPRSRCRCPAGRRCGRPRGCRRAPRGGCRARPRTASRRTGTAPFGNRCSSSRCSVRAPTRQAITRPLVAPRSTAATRTGAVSGVIAGTPRPRPRRRGRAGRWCASGRDRRARRRRWRCSPAAPRA